MTSGLERMGNVFASLEPAGEHGEILMDRQRTVAAAARQRLGEGFLLVTRREPFLFWENRDLQ